MKARILLCSAVLVALFAQASFAQGSTATDPAARRTQMLTHMLDLNSTQQGQVQGFLAAEEASIQTNKANLQAARANLIAAIKAGPASNFASIVAALSSIQQLDETARALAAAQIWAILSSDQQMKVGNNVEMLAGIGGGRGPGGPPNGQFHRGPH